MKGDPLSRRTVPTQQRGQRTVDRIKKAMLKVVAEEGYPRASTNRIADEAKVNIATVYHYFPNQHAIAHAIYDEVLLEMAELLSATILSDLEEPLDKSIRRFITHLVQFMEQEKQVLLRFSDQIPDLRTGTHTQYMINLAKTAGRSYLRHKLRPSSEEELERKLYFILNITMGMVQGYLRDPPKALPKSRFVNELAGIVTQYLVTGVPQMNASSTSASRSRTPTSRKSGGTRS